MEIEVYADILFALNFFMDLNILFLTVILSRLKLSVLRITAAGSLLALYGTVMFYPELALWYSLPGRIAVSAGAIFLLKKRGRWIDFLKVYSVFWTVSVLVGGVTAALAMKTDMGSDLQAVLVNGTLYLNIHPVALMVGILLSYLLMIVFKKICTRNFTREKILIKLCICLKNQSFYVTGLIDTGCELTVPGSGDGVILISRRLLKNGIPEDAIWISAGTINGENMIPVFYPERIVCCDSRFEINKNAAVGVIDREFAGDSLYQAVMNPDVLRENNINGGRGHEKKIQNVSGAVAGKSKGKMGWNFTRADLLYRRKRYTAAATEPGRRGGASFAAECSGGPAECAPDPD